LERKRGLDCCVSQKDMKFWPKQIYEKVCNFCYQSCLERFV